MLTDDLKCDDCQLRGSECECAHGPSWSKERGAWNESRVHFQYCTATAHNGQFQCMMRARVGTTGEWPNWQNLGGQHATLAEAEQVASWNRQRDAFMPRLVRRTA